MEKSFPLEDDDMNAWDDILSLRRLYLRETSSKMEVDDVYGAHGETASLSSVLATNYINLCGAALNQKNYAVTFKTTENYAATIDQTLCIRIELVMRR